MPSSLPDVSSVPFVARLASFGDRAALVTPDGTVSYAELAARVEALGAHLGTSCRLVLVAGANEVSSIVAYLAALSAGHPVILVPGDSDANLAAVESAYDPDVVIRGDTLLERRAVSTHDLHPSLALLLSTSGSTGSPKLVRLSADNLQANAESIATYLSIRETDVAATTLPMHYCYGLSVINSHLLRGASLLLTSLSVVDGCFWELFRRHGGTTFAGVPYTFDLLDRVGFDTMDLPSLRYVTQAGGHMPAAQVERYAALGQSRGFDLFVMYGQTEATARMAYLPPDLAVSHPSSIGIPIPGGRFALEPLPDMPSAPSGTADASPEVGELVYSGDNVMLGYAETPDDLAQGRAVTVLRTGDVARRNGAGLYEIIGRRSRFAKIFGLRIDLDQAERLFGDAGVTGYCADGDGALVVAVESDGRADLGDRIARIAERQLGLPSGAVRTFTLTEVPRLTTGKPDYRSVAALAAAAPNRPCSCVRAGCACVGTQLAEAIQDAVGQAGLRAVYARVLGRSDVRDTDSFVTLGGDSLSYVEMSIRLEEALGHLPPNWHVTPVGELAPSPRRRWTGLRTLETNVLLRATAILAIVATHGNLLVLVGGAHLLLGMAGFNFGRFQLSEAPRKQRVRRLTGSIVRIVVPSMLWIAAAAVITSTYSWQTVTLLNGVVGPEAWAEPAWHYWFIEALVYILLALMVAMALPVVDRVERRWPFWLPVCLAALALLTRYEVVTLRDGDVTHRAHIIFWLFALGWATAKACSSWHRALVSTIVVVTVPGFFQDPGREWVVIAGMLLLVWVPHVRVPAVAARAIGVLASASLYIYLAHWQVYPHFENDYPLIAVLLSLTVGIVFWLVATRVPAYQAGRKHTPGPVTKRRQPAAR